MKAKKVILMILAVALICAISVTGTLAFLKADTVEVKNTFVAAGGGSLFKNASGEIVLNESLAVRDTTTGAYSLDTSNKVTENNYIVLPGTTVDKDPAVSVTEKNDVPAYVYVEIVDATGGKITWEIADGWTLASGITGAKGGVVYYLATPIVADLAPTDILKNNEITVVNENDLDLGDSGKTIKFYGYLAQSVVNGTTDAVEVYKACFLN